MSLDVRAYLQGGTDIYDPQRTISNILYDQMFNLLTLWCLLIFVRGDTDLELSCTQQLQKCHNPKKLLFHHLFIFFSLSPLLCVRLKLIKILHRHHMTLPLQEKSQHSFLLLWRSSGVPKQSIGQYFDIFSSFEDYQEEQNH